MQTVSVNCYLYYVWLKNILLAPNQEQKLACCKKDKLKRNGILKVLVMKIDALGHF